MTAFDAVFSAASQLTVDERLQLIEALASSVPDDKPPSLSPEWLAEIERRCDEIDRGTVTPVPWEAVRGDLFSKLGPNRAN